MARKHSKSGKKRTLKQRQRKYKGGSKVTADQRGGGWGFTGAASIPGAPGTVSNPQVFTGIGDCRATEPGYTIPYSQYGASMKGLPGMSGGKRTRKGSKGKTRKHRQRGGSMATPSQRGGRYGFFPEGASDITPNGSAWWAGSYAPIQRIGCEGGSFNPLNPTHTGSSAPPGAASPNYYMAAGKGLMAGGAQLAPATYGVGNVDSMYHYSPTAGYANTASTWKDSVGAPIQIQVPFAARSMNQACLSTGGHPPLTGALQAGGRSAKRKGKGKGRSRKGNRKQGGGATTLFGFTVPTSLANLQGMYTNAKSRVLGSRNTSLNAAVGNAYAATNTAGTPNMANNVTPNVVNNVTPNVANNVTPNVANNVTVTPNVAPPPLSNSLVANNNRNNRNNNLSMQPNMAPAAEGEESFGPDPFASTTGGRSRKSRKSSQKKKTSRK
jgi:hypothetical protein